MTAQRGPDLEHALRDEELRPQLVSWGIAIAAAIAWLVLVYSTPLPSTRAVPESPIPAISFDPRAHLKEAAGIAHIATIAAKSSVPNEHGHGAATGVDVAGIFVTTVVGQTVADVVRLIPGVEAVQGEVGAKGARGDKSTIASRDFSRPGMSSFATPGAGTASSVGAVRHAATIEPSNFRASALPVVRAAPLDNSSADATELGAFVRARVSQLQTCYLRAGDANLAGVVALRLTLGAGGVVRSAEIARRTWSGPGAAPAEDCLLTTARAWLMAGGREGSTVTLPISFTRGQ